MFTLDDDFDIEEDFLCTGFEFNSANQNQTKEKTEPKKAPHHSSINGLNPKGTQNESVPSGVTKKGDFLDAWRFSEENILSTSNFLHQKPHSRPDFVRATTPEGLRTEVVTRMTKTIRTRKFPGPAGLLPERTCNSSFISTELLPPDIVSEKNEFHNFEEKEVYSQTTSRFFEEPGSAWRSMLEDLGENGDRLLANINLGSLRGKQVKSGFKAPFLAVSVHSIDCSLPDPSLILKDQIEEMHGTLHRDVWEEWKGELVVGSVLVLRNAGVVSAGTSSRRQFLNITANNITAIYCPKQDNNIKVTQMDSNSHQDISKAIAEWEQLKQQLNQPKGQVNGETLRKPLFGSWTPPQSSSQSSSGSCGSGRPVFRPRLPAQHQGGRPSQQEAVRTKRPRISGSSPALRPPPPPQPRRCLDKFLPSLPQGQPTPKPQPPKESKPKQTNTNIFASSSDLDKSIVDSMLDGIDTDSLFDDF